MQLRGDSARYIYHPLCMHARTSTPHAGMKVHVGYSHRDAIFMHGPAYLTETLEQILVEANTICGTIIVMQEYSQEGL